MASIVTFRIEAEIDHDPIRGFPFSTSFSIDEVQEFDYDEPADNNDTTFSALPANQIDTVQVLILRCLNAVGIRLEGSESGNVALRLSADGGFIAWGLSALNTNLTVNVNAAAVARLKGLVGGT